MKIEKLSVYPVKSLRGVEVQESPIDEYGFKYDRMYALAYPTKGGVYQVLTQRQEPALARIRTEITGSELVLTYDEKGKHREARLPLDLATIEKDLPSLDMELWDLKMVCSDYGAVRPDLKEFFAEFLEGKNKFNDTTVIVSKVRRPVPPKGPESEAFVTESGRTYNSSFQDIYPGTIMATASFAELEERVEIKGGDPVDARSFRMNMVVGTDEPWIEDDWKRLKIGDHQWFVDCLCERCSIPAVDPEQGTVRPTKQPLPELNRFRIMEKGKTPCFGLNLFSKDKDFVVRVGDPVEVLETTS